MKQLSAWMAISMMTLVCLVGTAGAQSGKSAAAEGRWITESGNLEIDIAPCGAALCGTVVKVLANRSMSNSNASSKAEGSAMGLKILTDLMPAGEGEWKGSIYNRENGKTYDCKIEPLPGNQLKVRSYILVPLMGKTQLWRRAAAS